jgi:hypothetical protein
MLEFLGELLSFYPENKVFLIANNDLESCYHGLSQQDQLFDPTLTIWLKIVELINVRRLKPHRSSYTGTNAFFEARGCRSRLIRDSLFQ